MSEGSGSPGAVTASAAVDVNTYLNELLAEREKPSCTGHAARLLEQGEPDAFERTSCPAGVADPVSVTTGS